MSDDYRWVEHKPGDWWCELPEAGGEPNPTYPPDMRYSFAPEKDGSQHEEVCGNLFSYYNGAMPDTATDDDSETLHVCDLDDLIETLEELRDAIKTQAQKRSAP